jgi:DNA-binding NarL/FixJ family response regulator
MDTINIILVDDHKIVRDGIRAMMLGNKQFKVIGEAATADALFKLLTSINPDILVMDIAMPGLSGIEATRQIITQFPAIKVLVLSAVTDEQQVMDMVSAGAHGFVNKDVSKNELFTAIQAIMNGDIYFCETLTNIINRSYINQLKGQRVKPVDDPCLSKREIEIIQLLTEGLAAKTIAEKLFISSRTVETHKMNILEKLGLKNTVELTKYAIKVGFIKL